MINVSMKAMLEAGVHFGHQTRRWNPKMGRYIFGKRNSIHIIDLQKTVKELKKVYAFVKEQAQAGRSFLFVGTKKQAQEIVRGEALRCQAAYVADKWLGGTLTNFATLRKSVKRLEELEKWETEGIFNVLSKKEVSRLSKEKLRLGRVLAGIRALTRPPDIMFVVDPVEEDLAVSEARRGKIPIVAVCDTDCDPDLIDHPIPGNDDAARSIKLFCAIIADAVLEGRAAAAAAPGTQPAAGEEQLADEVVPPPDGTSPLDPDAPTSGSLLDETDEVRSDRQAKALAGAEVEVQAED